MADLSLRLPVFISSSSELLPEREAAERAVRAQARASAPHGLLLHPFRWETDTPPFAGPFQATLNEPLREAEHVVVLFWRKAGEGTIEEYLRALDQARRGETDTVSIYFKVDAPVAPTADPLGGAAVLAEPLRPLYGEIERDQLARVGTFSDAADFERRFAFNLQDWAGRWVGVRDCCRYALENSGPLVRAPSAPDRTQARRRNQYLALLAGAREYLGRAAVDTYQQFGPQSAVHRPLSATRLAQLVPDWAAAAPVAEPPEWSARHLAPPSGFPLRIGPRGEPYIADYEWFWYFAASGLADAIRANRWEAVARVPYVNDVHQYLRGYAHCEGLNLSSQLRNWLHPGPGVPTGESVVRDFAAYVLGMLGDYDAQPALFEAYLHDDSGDVRAYSLMSLGRLRARRYVPDLVRRFFTARDDRARLMLSQVVCTIVGVAAFPL